MAAAIPYRHRPRNPPSKLQGSHERRMVCFLINNRNNKDASPRQPSVAFSITLPSRPGQHPARQRNFERLGLGAGLTWAFGAFAIQPFARRPRHSGHFHRQRATQRPHNPHRLRGSGQQFAHLGRAQNGLQLGTEPRRLMPARDHQPAEFAWVGGRATGLATSSRQPPHPIRHPPQPPGTESLQQSLNPCETGIDPAMHQHRHLRRHPPHPQHLQNPTQDRPQGCGDVRLR